MSTRMKKSEAHQIPLQGKEGLHQSNRVQPEVSAALPMGAVDVSGHAILIHRHDCVSCCWSDFPANYGMGLGFAKHSMGWAQMTPLGGCV